MGMVRQKQKEGEKGERRSQKPARQCLRSAVGHEDSVGVMGVIYRLRGKHLTQQN
jgi:hypothetical protein